MKDNTVLKNVKIRGVLTDLTVKDGKIAAIGRTVAPGRECGGAHLVPGLIDIHTHGIRGADTMDGDLTALATAYAKAGTTSFLPTTMTLPLRDAERVAEQVPTCQGGAHVLGLHLEGPYLSPFALGAQNPAFARDPVWEEVASIPYVKMITVAPELPGAEAFISAAAPRMVVCLGHTRADYETSSRALAAGAVCLTHTCNAMPPLLHRAPGPIGAALMADAYVQVICDGIHLHPAMVMALWRMFGTRRMILISDSMRATGLPDGAYDLGGQEITVSHGIARTSDGALAGSTSTLFSCVRHAIEFGIPAEDAFRMASETPAALLGVPKGKIEVGYDADFCLLDDQGRLLETLILA